MESWIIATLPSLGTLAELATLATLAILGGGGLLKLFPALAKAVPIGALGRSGELDGLRGGLSLLVVLHHCIIFRAYCATGEYGPPIGNFDNLAGEAAVALFFMATAYLYWGRLLNGHSMNWSQLYLGRLRRLVPMYVVSVAILVAIVMTEGDFVLRVAPAELATEIGHWLSFAFLPLPDINALPQTDLIQVVLWTLRYEWQFVFCLPILALFARGRLPWLLYVTVLVTDFTTGSNHLYSYFVGGLVAAHLRSGQSMPKVPPQIWAALGIVALVALPIFYHNVYGPVQLGLLTLVFLGAMSGVGPWALLRLRALRFLGLISYSLYLLHHMVLHVFAERIYGAAQFAALEGWQMQGAVIAIIATAMGLSTLTYLLVERPWLR